jgi:hypothetical protein
MPPNDVSLREHGAQLRRGVIFEELFVYWSDERGNDVATPRRDFPNCVPVGSHAPHAAWRWPSRYAASSARGLPVRRRRNLDTRRQIATTLPVLLN